MKGHQLSLAAARCPYHSYQWASVLGTPNTTISLGIHTCEAGVCNLSPPSLLLKALNTKSWAAICPGHGLRLTFMLWPQRPASLPFLFLWPACLQGL